MTPLNNLRTKGPLNNFQTTQAQISLHLKADQGLHCLLTESIDTVHHMFPWSNKKIISSLKKKKKKKKKNLV